MEEGTRAEQQPHVPGHRAALLEGAIECLQSVGYGRTTARAVVAASNTNLGSIAYHFGSIEKLRDEALIESARRWLAPITQAAHSAEPGRRLGSALDAYLRSLPRQRTLIAAFFEALAQAERKQGLRRALAAGYDELRKAIDASAGPGAPGDTGASLVIAIFDGLMIQWLIDPDRVNDLGEAAAELEPALRRLL